MPSQKRGRIVASGSGQVTATVAGQGTVAVEITEQCGHPIDAALAQLPTA
ncbi:hypothetical protein [Streptomyces violascens]